MANPKIQLRHDTAANWTTKNPILAEGEVGTETDTYKIKVGDGTTAYNDLPYATGGGGEAITYTSGNGINISNTNVISVVPDGSTLNFNADGKLELVLDGTGPLATQLNNMVTLGTAQTLTGRKTFSGAYSQNITYPIVVGGYKINTTQHYFEGYAGIASNLNLSQIQFKNLISCWYHYDTETLEKQTNSIGYIFTPATAAPYTTKISESYGPISSLIPQRTYIGGDNLYRMTYIKNGTRYEPTPFKIYDESDKTTITSFAYPSDNYQTLGTVTSGTTLTAPTNGWFVARGQATDVAYLILICQESQLITQMMTPSTGWGMGVSLPVKKGHTVKIEYANCTLQNFFFIQAEGN